MNKYRYRIPGVRRPSAGTARGPSRRAAAAARARAPARRAAAATATGTGDIHTYILYS